MSEREEIVRVLEGCIGMARGREAIMRIYDRLVAERLDLAQTVHQTCGCISCMCRIVGEENCTLHLAARILKEEEAG